MEQSKPELRSCRICNSEVSLNLFRADGDICRYCEMGLDAPIQDQRMSRPRGLTAENKENNQDANQNNSTSGLNYDHIKTELRSKSNESSIKILAKKIFQDNIWEIVIALGCISRWSNDSTNEDDIIDWLSSQNNTRRLLTELNSEDIELLRAELSINFSMIPVNATVIKASIRSLIRSNEDRRISLLNFIKSKLISGEDNSIALNIIKSDLMNANNELGYPIPIVPSPKIDNLEIMSDTNTTISSLCIGETIKQLSEKLNNSELVFSRSEIENHINDALFNQISATADNEYQLMKEIINESISIGYLIFGLQTKPNGQGSLASNDIIDLNLSSID